MNIISDSREQILIFKETNIAKLDEGDYTTNKLLNKFHIERKSGEDLYGSIIQGHARFRREIVRAITKKIKLVVYVECSRSDFILKKFKQGYKRKMPSATLSTIIDTMAKKYDLEFVFCNSRDDMRIMMIQRFKLEESKLD